MYFLFLPSDKCQDHFKVDDDGLDALVSALPPVVTERFGDVVWAHGGSGFGWWPAFLYDPRLTTGSARQLARKFLGKRQLVYFFECLKTPFDCLVDSKIMNWDHGLAEDFHLGKIARANSKQRSQDFEQALQMAAMELSLPKEQRMEWNHPKLPSPPEEQDILSPKSAAARQKRKGDKESSKKKKKKRKRKRSRSRSSDDSSSSSTSSSSDDESSSYDRKRDRKKSKRKRRQLDGGFGFLPSPSENRIPSVEHSQVPTNRRNLNQALAGLEDHRSNTLQPAQQIEPAEDGELFITLILRKTSSSVGSEPNVGTSVETLGFCRLPSRKTSTFADARSVIGQEIDLPNGLQKDGSYKFFVPSLGPVSRKQETTLGPMWAFLRSSTNDARLGNGSVQHPCKVLIIVS